MAETGIHPDRLFEALQHECRRELLLHLCEDANGTTDLEEAIEHLTDRIDEQLPPDLLELQCYHLHLPKLDEIGLVSYDWEAGDVTYSGEFPPERICEIIGQDCP